MIKTMILCDLCGAETKGEHVDVVRGGQRQICRDCVRAIRDCVPAHRLPQIGGEPKSPRTASAEGQEVLPPQDEMLQTPRTEPQKAACVVCRGMGWINGWHGRFERCPKCKPQHWTINPPPCPKCGGTEVIVLTGGGVGRCCECAWRG